MSTPTALITGAGTGIGLAATQRFLREGWNVVVVGRRPAPLLEIKKTAPESVLVLECDLTLARDVQSLAERLHAEPRFANSLTALVNNAGIAARKSFQETDDDEWINTFQTNLLGSVRITRALLPLLIKNRGVILNVSSTVALKPPPGFSAYSAIKAGMVNWTHSLALELGPQGVRANCVCPGIVDTPIHAFHSLAETEKDKVLESLAGRQPLGRIGQPEDVAHGIWSLCAPGSEWITGAVLSVDGGINLT